MGHVTYGLSTHNEWMGPMETHGLPMGYPQVIQTALPHNIKQNNVPFLGWFT